MAKYQAFISYSRAADNQLAPELKSALQRFAKSWYRLRAIHVFCDQTNLTANPDLWGMLEKQVDNSEYFIYLASPKAAASKWVQKELNRFYARCGGEKIIIVLTDGSLVWSDASASFDWTKTNAVPNLSEPLFKKEPIWLDLSWIRKEQLSVRDPRFLDVVANLSAVIRGVDKDILIGQDVTEQRKAKRFRIFSVTGLVLLACFLAAASFFAIRSERRSQDRLVRTFVGNGVGLLEAGDYLAAFPWFVQALVNERSAERKELHNFRIQNLYSQIPELLQVWKPDLPVLQTAFLDNRSVLIISGPSADWNSGEFECWYAKKGVCKAEIRIVNTETGMDVFSPIVLNDGIRTAQLSGDKTLLASFSVQNRLRLWNLKNGRLLWERKVDALPKAEAFACAIAFNRQGSRVLFSYSVGDNGSRIVVYDLHSGDSQYSRNEAYYVISNPQFLGTGDSVIYLSDALKIWNIKRPKVTTTKTPYFDRVYNFEMSPDNRHLALSGDRDIKNFKGFGASVVSMLAYASVDSLQKPDFTKQFDFSPNRLRFDAEGNVLGVNNSSTTEAGSFDQGTQVLDVTNGNPLTSLIKRSQEVELSFDKEGKKLVLSCRDGTTEVLEVDEPGASSDATQRFFLLHDGSRKVKSIFSPDGRYLLTSGVLVKLWRLPLDGTIQAVIDREKFESEPADTSARWYVAYGESSGDSVETNANDVYIFDRKLNKRLATLKHESQVHKAVLSPDDNFVATAAGSDAFVWQREDGQLLYQIPAPNSSAVQSMAFSPDGKKLVIAFFDFSLRVWKTDTGVPITPYMHHVISSMDNLWVSFSKDGRKVLSTDQHKSSRIWDAATGDILSAPARFDITTPYDSVENRMRINRATNPTHPLDAISMKDLQIYAELISSQQLEADGSFAPISTEVFLEKWKLWKNTFKQ